MRYDPEIHHRRSLRLKGWDYSSKGAYFVTICAWKKEFIFIDEGIGRIVCEEWGSIPGNYPAIRLDDFVLMPNHLHAILWIENAARAQQAAPLRNIRIGSVIRTFKSKAAVMINRYRNTIGSPVWQRNFYERIIRNEHELDAIRNYMRENPLKWGEDEENPDNIANGPRG
jgi:REP element-mobilizing transposase RayT